jgi:hypothetical protein
MKKLIIVSLLLLSNCSPPAKDHKFSVGECFKYVPDGAEVWEFSTYKPYKVLEVGRHSYRVSLCSEDKCIPDYKFEFSDEKYYEKVECPL